VKALAFLLSISISAFAFQRGEVIELNKALNARWGAKFTKENNNIATVLPKGTQGVVEEVMKFKSGGMGVKVAVSTGKAAGKSYWLYHHPQKPSLAYKGGEPIKRDPKAKKEVETLREIIAAEDQDEEVKHAAIETLDKGAKGIKRISPDTESSDCCKDTVAGKGLPEVQLTKDGEFPENNIRNPEKDINSLGLTSPVCRSRATGYDICSWRDESGQFHESSFKFENDGGNKIFGPTEYYTGRSWEFEYKDMARQDMSLLVVDQPDDTTSHANWSLMMFFPRKVLPSIKATSGEFHVTLPTGEKVRYNAKTKEVLSGDCQRPTKSKDVFCEGPLNIKANGRAGALDLRYQGEGIMIKTDASVLPIGDNVARPVTLSRFVDGVKVSCQLKTTDLWREKSPGAEDATFKWPTDDGFVQYLATQKNCAALVKNPL
jgi:hypothetical protein